MKEGAWINTRTGEYWWVDEHSKFVQQPANQRAMGLSAATLQKLAEIGPDSSGSGEKRNAILITVMQAGFIRFRGHGVSLTCEFWGDKNRNLWACYSFLEQVAGPVSYCVLNNLKTNEQISLPFEEFQKRMQSDPDGVLRVARKLSYRG